MAAFSRLPAAGRKLAGAARILPVVMSLCLSLNAATSLAQELSFKSFPYLIFCEVQGVHRAFYFSKLGPDGVAVYLTPDRQAGMITIDGVGRRIGGEQSGSCANKTLDNLKMSGQAHYLPE